MAGSKNGKLLNVTKTNLTNPLMKSCPWHVFQFDMQEIESSKQHKEE